MLAHGGERRERTIGVDRELREHAVLVRQDFQHAVRFAQRGICAHDQFVQVFPAPEEGRPEFVQDDPQPLRLGQAVDVREQVDIDRARGVLYG